MLWILAIASALFTAVFVIPLRALIIRLGIVDNPRVLARKKHQQTTPLGGGVALYAGVLIPTLILWRSGNLLNNTLHTKTVISLFLGGIIIILGGLIDDRFHLRARYQFVFPFLATLIAIAGGVGSHSITNPLGGSFPLDKYVVELGFLGTIVILADTVTFLWLMGMMYTTKFLDWLDGLVTGVVLIGSLVLLIITNQTQWYDPEIARITAIFAGACAGFLCWNYAPAKIFLGEGGSLFTGFFLASLAALAGGRLAIAALVLVIPILDVARVLVRRIQRKQPIFHGDREHLHLQLVDSGLSVRQSVLLLYSISLLLGATVLFLQGEQQLIAQVCILALLLITGVWFTRRDKINL